MPEFKREERYLVIKRKRLGEEEETHIRGYLRKHGLEAAAERLERIPV